MEILEQILIAKTDDGKYTLFIVDKVQDEFMPIYHGKLKSVLEVVNNMFMERR